MTVRQYCLKPHLQVFALLPCTLSPYWSQLEAFKVLPQPALGGCIYKDKVSQGPRSFIFFYRLVWVFLKHACFPLNFSSALFLLLCSHLSLLWINLRQHTKEAFSLSSLHLSFVCTFVPWGRASPRVRAVGKELNQTLICALLWTSCCTTGTIMPHCSLRMC